GDGTTGAGVALPPGFTLPPGTPPQVVTAIGWALAQLGTRYSFGGDRAAAHSGDSARECDCSSLVMGAYRAAGGSLPRVTGHQVHAGTPVASLADARPGDLIFIPGSGGTMAVPGHVELYSAPGSWCSAAHRRRGEDQRRMTRESNRGDPPNRAQLTKA